MATATVLAVLVAGWLIGATGIGGVLVVPALTVFSGFEPARAIAASGLGFGFPALLALWLLRRQRELARSCMPLVAGALPGALGGALLVHRLEPRLLLLGVAALVLFAGARGLRPSRRAAADARPAPGPAAMFALGLAVGLGSALTGTGGPVLVIPLLMLWRQPLALTMAAAQGVQLPVAAAATAVHAAAGGIDWAAGCLLGVLLLAGSLAGHHMGRRLAAERLQTLVALLLLAVGVWYAWLALH